MDPGLEEAILRTPPAVEIEAVALLRPGYPRPDALRIVTTFGSIVTCRIPAGSVRSVRAHPAVASLKAARVVEPSLAALSSSAEAGSGATDQASRDVPSGTAVVGVLDWGLDFPHPAFRRRDGGTRLLALWDQRDRIAGQDVENSYGYGRILDRARIDRALSTVDPYSDLDYHPAASDPRGIGAHGTITTSIAAGSTTAPPGASGIAPHAELVFVHLATGVLPGTSNLGDSVRILEGIDFVRRVAEPRPWVINLSLGRTGGDHSGRSLVEMAMDHVVQQGPGRAIVNSAGNYFDKNTAAQGTVQAGGRVTLEWVIAPHDPTINELEVWYSGRDTFRLELAPPGSRSPIRAELGQRLAIEVDGQAVGRAYHRRREPLTNDHHIDIFIEPGAPAGAWHVTLVGVDVVDGRFHAWIERDAAVPGAQSRFPVEQASPRSTLGTLATTFRTYVVGAATEDGRNIAPFSSSGPTRDGRTNKPNLVARGVSVTGARSTSFGAPAGSGGIIAQSGTSMAAPQVTGTIALLFSLAPRRLDDTETRALVLGTTRPIPGVERDRTGSGLLDTEAAVEALGAWLQGRERDMSPDAMLDTLEGAIPDSMARRAFRSALDLARAQLPPDLEVVGGPGAVPSGGIRAGDLVVRIHPGEPVTPFVGLITSEAIWSAGGAVADAEYAGPGYYTRVAPMYGATVIRSRRVLDSRRRLAPNHILLRRRGRRYFRRRPFYRGVARPFAAVPIQPAPMYAAPPPQEPLGIEPPEPPGSGLEEPGILDPGFEEPGFEEPGVEEPGSEELYGEEDAPKLTVATAWINTFKSCGQKPLEYCDDIAEGFGGLMKKAGHDWAINLSEKKPKAQDWSDRVYGGADHAAGRGVDTVDFAMLVTHGGLRDKVWVGLFDQAPCRFRSDQARFGNGKLKWVVMDGCRSLQIDQKKNVTPQAIWKQAFDGLHMILGFHDVVSDASWSDDRGADFALRMIMWDDEIGEAWLDAAYSWWLDDYPVALAGGLNTKDADRRLENETLSAPFPRIAAKDVKGFMWIRRS